MRDRLSGFGTVAWGKEGAKKWLQLLNDYWIGPKNQYLCGNEITIADYFGACMVTIGELVNCDLSAYPNVQRWIANMKKLKSWDAVNEVFSGFVAGNKAKEFVRIA
jgi:glutathione S-transferase